MNKDAQEVTLTIGGAEVTIRAGVTPIPSHRCGVNCSNCDTPVDRNGRPLPPGSRCKLRECVEHDDDAIACNAVWDCPQFLRQVEAHEAEDGDPGPLVFTPAFRALPEAKQKRLLLKKYAGKEPKRFTQYDFSRYDGQVWAEMTTDLMQGLGMRVLIEEDMPQEQVLEGLERISEGIRRSGLFKPMGVNEIDRLRNTAAPAPEPMDYDLFEDCDTAPVDNRPPAIGSPEFRELPKTEQKRRILENYSERGDVEYLEVHHGFLSKEPNDPSQVPDADGDWEEACMQTEVRLPDFGDVCVHIRPGVSKEQSVRLLRKTANYIELRGLFRDFLQDGGQE